MAARWRVVGVACAAGIVAVSAAGVTDPGTAAAGPPRQVDPTSSISVNSGLPWTQISAGANDTCGIRTDQTLWCWGYNQYGEVGDGTLRQHTVPTPVRSSGVGWRSISAGGGYACGIRLDASLWCWGFNDHGQLGRGDKVTIHAPRPVAAGTTWLSVATWAFSTCGIRTDHTLWCWGDNASGQLGDGTVKEHLRPHQVGTTASWTEVSVGFNEDGSRTCALRRDASLWCWGVNRHGELGDGTRQERHTPVQISPAAHWSTVSSGAGQTCATQQNGSLWCWGYNRYGDVGDGTFTERDLPVQIGTDRDWVRPTASSFSTCALRADGSVWCWGWNREAELGDGTTEGPRPYPKQIASAASWMTVSSDNRHVCALQIDGTAWCWGPNSYGQLGLGSIGGIYLSPAQTTNGHGPQLSSWIAVAAADDQTCGIKEPGQLLCWGLYYLSPYPVAFATGSTWTALSLGYHFGCAIRQDGTLWCWGSNSDGQLGNGSAGDSATPVQVGVDSGWATVTADESHACATRADQTLWCWGDNHWGQLGDGTTTDRYSPVQVGASSSWRSVSAGSLHTCAVAVDHSLWCWGINLNGQLGDGTTDERTTPTRVGTDFDWVSVTAGHSHTCGTRTGGGLWCWGWNIDGQLGDGATTDSPVPVEVKGGHTWASVSAGYAHTCATTTDRVAWCWGNGDSGQRGDGTTDEMRLTPRRVLGGASWTSVSGGGPQTCGVRSDASAWCWGDNAVRELGTGLEAPSLVPARVRNR